MTTSSTIIPDVPSVQRPEQKVAGHIRDAAEKTGVPFDFLLAQANQESRLNPEARSSNSSAMGLFQFTAGTWMDMIKRHGADHGLERYADAIVRGGDGRWTVRNRELKKEILDLRRDPALSALMAAEYAKDNERVLEARLGRQVSHQDLYLAHFLGARGAMKVLRGKHENEGEHKPDGLIGAAQANPDVFVEPSSGEHRSVNDIYAAVERRFRRAMTEASRVAGLLEPQVDLAALRPETRPPETPPSLTVDAPSPPPLPDVTIAMEDAVTVSMAELPSAISSFPARLPPRGSLPGANAAASGESLDGSLSFPLPLPPRVTGARADSAHLRTLLTANEDPG